MAEQLDGIHEEDEREARLKKLHAEFRAWKDAYFELDLDARLEVRVERKDDDDDEELFTDELLEASLSTKGRRLQKPAIFRREPCSYVRLVGADQV